MRKLLTAALLGTSFALVACGEDAAEETADTAITEPAPAPTDTPAPTPTDTETPEPEPEPEPADGADDY